MEIFIRRLHSSDADHLARQANNKRVWDNLRDLMPHPYSLEDALEFIALTEREQPAQTFGIISQDGELCGVIGLVKQQDVYRRTAEIGYWIGEAFWGRGIATKAVELISKYGFEELQLERIFTGVFEYNKASMRVLEKNGFIKEGIFRNSVIKNGHIYDEHRYAKLKNE